MDDVQNAIIDNEREWRRHIIKKLDCIEIQVQKTNDKVNSVELKVAGLGSFFGFIGAYVKAKFFGGS